MNDSNANLPTDRTTALSLTEVSRRVADTERRLAMLEAAALARAKNEETASQALLHSSVTISGEKSDPTTPKPTLDGTAQALIWEVATKAWLISPGRGLDALVSQAKQGWLALVDVSRPPDSEQS